MHRFYWLIVTGFIAVFGAVGCSADDQSSGWVLKDGVRAGGQLQRLPEVPTGSFWTLACERSNVIGEVDQKLLVRRDLPSAEVIAVDPATGDWGAVQGLPRVWGGETLYPFGYQRMGEAEWIWGFPNITLYRPDPEAEWREASIGFLSFKRVEGVALALSTAEQPDTCKPPHIADLYRHDGDDRWTRLRGGVASISVAAGHLFITEVVDDSIRLLVSDDAGVSWTPAQVELRDSELDVISYAGGFAMSTGRGVFTSEDGLAWQRVPLPDGAYGPVGMVDSDFGPLVWNRSPHGPSNTILLQLVDGRLELFAHQPPEAGDLGVVGGHLAVVSRWKGVAIYDPDAARWNPVGLALGRLLCLAQDAEAAYAGKINNISRLDRLGADAWQALPRVGYRTSCAIPTDSGLIANIERHPDAPDHLGRYLARYDNGAWQLLEPAIHSAYIRRDGVRFGCDKGVITRYDTDGRVEAIGSIGSPSRWCGIFAATQNYLLVAYQDAEKLALLDLNTGETYNALSGLLDMSSDHLPTAQALFETDQGLFLHLWTGASAGQSLYSLMRWDAEKKKWVEVEPPPLKDGSQVRAFAASQTTVYASTNQAIWRLDTPQGAWTQLVDWDGPPFDYTAASGYPFEFRALDAWNDELLVSTEDFQVYRYIPPEQ